MKYASNLLNGNWLLGIKMRLNPQFQRPRLWSKQRDMSHDLRMADNRLNNLAASLWSLDFRNSEIFYTEKTLQRCHFLTTRVLYRLPVKTVYQVCLLSCKYISQTFTCFIFLIFWVWLGWHNWHWLHGICWLVEGAQSHWAGGRFANTKYVPIITWSEVCATLIPV